MRSLREVQRAIGTVLLGGDQGALHGLVREDGLATTQRLAIYANNCRVGFEQALAATYPVIQRLAGVEWFLQHARSYQSTYPSRRGDLQYVGDRYADYLQSELVDSPYEYFVDVARLEWAYQEALVASDDAALDPQALAFVAPEHYPHIVLVPRTSVQLIASRYPLLAIWKANQANAAADAKVIALDDGPERLLVIRRDSHVELRSLAPATFTLLQRLSSGATLGEVVETHDWQDDIFNASLGELMLMRVFASYQLKNSIDAVTRSH